MTTSCSIKLFSHATRFHPAPFLGHTPCLKKHVYKKEWHHAALNCSAMRRVSIPQTSLQPIRIKRLDHFVITVKDLDATVDFYTRVLGMEVTTFKVCRRTVCPLYVFRCWEYSGFCCCCWFGVGVEGMIGSLNCLIVTMLDCGFRWIPVSFKAYVVFLFLFVVVFSFIFIFSFSPIVFHF